MPQDRLAALAGKLVAARRQGRRIALEDNELPQDFEEGFAVQERVVEALGSPIIGWKVMQVPQGPVIYAPLLEAGRVADGDRWEVAGSEPAGIELEVAFRMGGEVRAAAGGQQALDAVASAHVVFELCQSRIADPERRPRHVMLADCIANAGIVVGAEIADWRTRDLTGRAGQLLVDARVHAQGKSGDPKAALQLLAPALERRGRRLRAGEIVITGSLIGMNWLTGHHALQGTIEGCGAVTLMLEARAHR
jgi:2-keto-4-pentenoate hydratase